MFSILYMKANTPYYLGCLGIIYIYIYIIIWPFICWSTLSRYSAFISWRSKNLSIVQDISYMKDKLLASFLLSNNILHNPLLLNISFYLLLQVTNKKVFIVLTPSFWQHMYLLVTLKMDLLFIVCMVSFSS